MGSIEHEDTSLGGNEALGANICIGKYSVQGFTSSFGVVNYLGIPYGHVSARFRQARLIDPSQLEAVHDGRQYGPICPQPVDEARTWRKHLYEGIQHSGSLPVSEYDCLNLNVYTPAERSAQPLPVFVWIHGGGFVAGDGGPEYDGNFLVQHSMKLGKPFVFVAFNYRLGYFGFLSSEQLKAEAVAAGEVPCSNVGFGDQRLALQWVQNNIHHFGGDGNNITLAGESAGAWSILAHLRSNIPICQRAFIMSAPSLSPRDTAGAQSDFDHLVTATGISHQAPDDEKLACLREMSPSRLVALAPKSLICPSWDAEWFSHDEESTPLEKAGEFPSWLDGIVIGCTAQECAMLGILSGWTSWSIDTIHQAIPQSIPDSIFADEVMRAYGINSTSPDVALKGLIRFASEGLFTNVISSATTLKSTPVSIYRFDQVDTYKPSVFYGYAYHSLDNVFTCRLPAVAGDQAPPEWKATADEHSRSLIDFIYGQQPWEVYSSSRRIQSFNATKSGLVEWPSSLSWDTLASTPEREIMLRIGVGVLISLAT